MAGEPGKEGAGTGGIEGGGQNALPELVVELATELGWRPQEQFQGDPGKYKDPATFIRDLGKVNKSNERGKRTLERQLATATAKLDRMVNIVEKQTTDTITAKRNEVEVARLAAVEEGDTAKFNELDKQLIELDQQQQTLAPAKDAEGKPLHPAYVQWKQENSWYGQHGRDNAILTALADEVSDEMAAYNAPIPEVLEAIDAAIAEYQAGNGNNNEPVRKKINDVEGGDGGALSRHSNAITYASLDDMSKRLCDSTVASGLITRDGYLKSLQDKFDKDRIDNG